MTSEPSTTDAPGKPDPALASQSGEPAGPQEATPALRAGRARPTGNDGEVTLDWGGPRRLGDWAAELQIFEGAPNADKAELAIAATGDDGVRFSFSAQYPRIAPADMNRLAREYPLEPANRDNLLLLEVQNDQPRAARGWLRITNVEAGVVSGTFKAVLDAAAGAQQLEGRFRGPLTINCNVLALPSDAAARTGAAPVQPGPSWTNVAPNHPFCARYL